MGTWGAGNFSSDGALDYLGEMIDNLTNHVQSLLNKGTFADLDECGESELMPSVHIISLLCEHCNGAPPKQDMIASWRAQYLQRFDTQIDALGADLEFKNERRAVISNTFETLEQQSKRFWSR